MNIAKVFHQMGMQWNLHNDILHQIEKFVCSRYGQTNCSSVDTARYNLFRLKCRSDEALPPNLDCLTHSRRLDAN